MLSGSINSTANPGWLLQPALSPPGRTKHFPKASQEKFVTSQVTRVSAGVSRLTEPKWSPARGEEQSRAEPLVTLGVGTAGSSRAGLSECSRSAAPRTFVRRSGVFGSR